MSTNSVSWITRLGAALPWLIVTYSVVNAKGVRTANVKKTVARADLCEALTI